MGGRSNRRGPFDLHIHSLMLPNSSPGVRLQRCLRVGKSAFIRAVVRRGLFAPARASRCAVSGQESNLHTSATLAELLVPMASHTWQESNPQSSVLETVTPPLAQAYAPQLITEGGNSGHADTQATPQTCGLPIRSTTNGQFFRLIPRR